MSHEVQCCPQCEDLIDPDDLTGGPCPEDAAALALNGCCYSCARRDGIAPGEEEIVPYRLALTQSRARSTGRRTIRFQPQED
jgi:hypothetical protein